MQLVCSWYVIYNSFWLLGAETVVFYIVFCGPGAQTAVVCNGFGRLGAQTVAIYDDFGRGRSRCGCPSRPRLTVSHTDVKLQTRQLAHREGQKSRVLSWKRRLGSAGGIDQGDDLLSETPPQMTHIQC